MHPRELSISEYTYELPPDRIAFYPLAARDNSKLLIYDKGKITSDIYKNISAYLPPGSMIVLNNAKVIAARVIFTKETGGNIEIFCLEPYGLNHDYTSVMSATGSSEWKCMIGGAAKWKSGPLSKKLISGDIEIKLEVDLVAKTDDAYVARFSWEPASYSFAEIIELAGAVPLPPYIKRRSEASDKETYQTIYANEPGSVAAPTAGLHMTKQVFDQLDAKEIRKEFVTLHVGAGTFKPVKASVMEGHVMHAEWIEVDRSVIEHLSSHEGNIIATGTTAARTLESLYWMGVKTFIDPQINTDAIKIGQWDVYDENLERGLSRKESMLSLLSFMQRNNMQSMITQTQLMIAPSYKFKMINSLITNFHQPGSTLLLLVAAAVGDDWKKIYNYALENDFRFLSYGDGSLIHL